MQILELKLRMIMLQLTLGSNIPCYFRGDEHQSIDGIEGLSFKKVVGPTCLGF